MVLKAELGLRLATPCRLIEGPWWGACLGRQPGSWWLAHIDAAALGAEPLRRRVGFLNTLEDLLKHLGHRLQVGDGSNTPPGKQQGVAQAGCEHSPSVWQPGPLASRAQTSVLR